eukprot:3751601-Pleurochrysis_carterae.AAC.1
MEKALSKAEKVQEQRLNGKEPSKGWTVRACIGSSSLVFRLQCSNTYAGLCVTKLIGDDEEPQHVSRQILLPS